MHTKKRILVGARGSALSVIQARSVIALLKKAFPQLTVSLKKIITSGDKDTEWQRNDVGIFVKEIEQALLDKKIDIAVHSVKDLPSQLPQGLMLAAVPTREDSRDCIILKERIHPEQLKRGACIGTSSLRRAAQLLRWRPDLEIRGLRGNIDTRIKKLQSGAYDAIVIACAGIKRLAYKNINSFPLPIQKMLPAPGQGALGIEIREDDTPIKNIAQKINDRKSFTCISCERAFLKEIGAGCRLPLGAYAEVKNKQVYLQACVLSLKGKKQIRLSAKASFRNAEALGGRLAKKMLAKGAGEMLI